MEMCRQLTVSECGSGDWYVGFDSNGDGILSVAEQNIKAYQLGQAIATAAGANTTTALSDWTAVLPSTSFVTSGNNRNIRDRLGAGDTGDKQALVAADRRYPRRVAFARDNTNNLVKVSSSPDIYKPMGVGCPLDTTGTNYANNGCTYAGSPAEGTNYGKKGSNALWFRTTTSTSNPSANASYGNSESLFYYAPTTPTDGQPLLVPVLQIHDANNTSNIRSDGSTQDEFRDRWIQQPSDNTTIYNATFVLGNSPSRSAETSAGLQNFVRFLESWNNKTAKISGSFIQLKRSTFATGPISPIFAAKSTIGATNTANDSNANLSLFDYALDTYPTPNGSGLLPFYNAPTNRNWGFDVGLLSEQPDLFAQRFTLPPSGRPNEFFREVGRDDTWVKTLLCAGEASNQTGIPTTSVPTVTYTTKAVPDEYRPSGCPSPSDIPSDSL